MESPTRTKQLFISLTLGLGLTLGLLWLLGGVTLPVAQAAPSQCPGQRPLLQAGEVITVCLSGGCDYTSIQAAVDAAVPGDEILVASGVYIGVQNVPSLNTATFTATQVVVISKTVTIRGGYNADFSVRDSDTYSTTLDAQGQGRVLYITGDISPTIEGLRITGGDATGLGGNPWGDDAGGGVYVISATATISNNEVFNNTAIEGGGLYLRDSAATLSSNTVTSNTADYNGGGLYLKTSPATLRENIVSGNTAGDGGGLYLIWSDSTLIEDIISANSARQYGGGLYLAYSDATLSGNTIISNTANSSGGGLNLWSSAPTLRDNIIIANVSHFNGGGLSLAHSRAILGGDVIIANTADREGGGLSLGINSDATLTNNVIADNQANSVGGGLHVRSCSPRLLHTTIARNSSGDGSGVYVTDNGVGYYSTVALTNTILVSHSVGITVTGGNTVTVNGVLWYGTPVTVSQATTATVTVQNQHEGNPAFATDGCHLTAGSTAIDRGVNAGVTTDIDGDARPDGCLFDIGADEFMTGVACKIYLPLIMRQYQ